MGVPNRAIIVAVIPAGVRADHATDRSTLRLVWASLTRPYPVTWPMIALLALVPCYIFIGAWAEGRPAHVPALAADAAIPLEPVWGLVYGALYLFLILVPVFVVRHEPLIRRMFLAYLSVWVSSYVVFLVYPTAASRPAHVAGHSFAAWGLRTLYSADPPYNCFPSLHVAHSCISAFACSRVNRSVGLGTGVCAALVALSTLFTKQHYILDVAAGVGLAYAAYVLFLRSSPRDDVPTAERRLAPALALTAAALVLAMTAGYWSLYRFVGA